MTGYYPFQLLREWRDAAKAEYALMDLARGLEPDGITLTSEPRSQS